MDPLSELLSLLKPKSYITAGFDAGGSWALVLDDLAGRIKCYAVMEGECWLAVDAEDPILLREGDCFILPTGRRATIASDLGVEPKLASQTLDPDRSGEVVVYNGGGDVLLVGSRFELDGRHAEAMLGALPSFILVETSEDRARLRLYIDLMMEEFRSGRPGASQVAQNLSHMMLAQALRLYIENLPEGHVGWFSALADPKLSLAIAAIHSEPSRGWTVEGLARRAGMSRTSFSQRFGLRVGETPISYLTRWRMMSAGAKLVQGQETIAQIAMTLGYSSEQAFSTAFKRVMGHSPRHYARSQRAI